MNMISTGAFQNEMIASNPEENLVTKLVSAWEKKNSKSARAGGVSLMALSLAACGSSSKDDAEDANSLTSVVSGTTYTSVDAAFSAGAASVDITSDNSSVMMTDSEYAEALATAKTNAKAEVDITSDNKDVMMSNAEYSEALSVAKANAKSEVDITSDNKAVMMTDAEYAEALSVAKANAKAEVDITSDNKDVMMSNAEYSEALSVAKANAKAEVDITSDNKAVMMTEAEYTQALLDAKATVDTSADDTAAINNAVAKDTSFSNLADLVAAYKAEIAPAETTNYVLAATVDVVPGGDSATTISGTAGTIDGDNIAGGGGADTLNLTVTVADDDNSAWTSTSVETISIRSTGGTANDAAFVDLSFADVTGTNTIQLRRLGDDVEIDDLASLATVIELNNIATAADVNLNYDAASITGSSDTSNISIVSSSGGGDLVINGVETIAVTVTGTGSDMNIDGDSIAAVTIAGSGDYNVDFDASVTSANASNNSGGVTMNATAAANVTYTGGTGADTFAMGTTLTSADTIVGGDGADTLTVGGAGGALIPASSSVTGVQTLTATLNGADTLDANTVSFDNINILSAATTDDLTVTDVTDEVITLTQLASGTNIDVTDFSLADATGGSDTLTINVTNAHTTAVFDVDAINSTGGGIETLTLNLNQGVDLGTAAAPADDITVSAVGAGTALTITGGADATLGDATALTQTVINAGTATGDLTFTLGAANQTVTGGTGDDTFAFGANMTSADSAIGGTGANTVTATPAAGTAAPTLTNVQTATLGFATASATFAGTNAATLTTLNIGDTSTEDLVLSNLNAGTVTVRMASDDMAAGDTVRVDYAAGSNTAHSFVIGEIGDADNLAMGDVTITDNAGALTVSSDAEDAGTNHKIDDLIANDATSLTITTAGRLEIDAAGGGGAGALSATSATSATITTAGGLFLVDGTTALGAATSIVVDGANGNLTLTGATTATAATTLEYKAAAGQTTTVSGATVSDADVTSVTLTSTGASADLSMDGLIDVDHVRTLTATATDGGNIDIGDIELLGVDNDGTTDIATQVTLTATGGGTNAGSTVTVAAMATATATLDSLDLVSDVDGTISVTTGANLTITDIDGSANNGTATLDATATAAALTVSFGSGTNTITLEEGLAHQITLNNGGGSDTFNVLDDGEGTSAAIVVTNFQGGATGDTISIDVSDIDGADAVGAVNELGTALGVAVAPIMMVDADGAGAATAGASLIKLTDTFANTAAVVAAVDGAALTGVVAADNATLLFIWTDGADSYLSSIQSKGANWADADGGEDLIQFSGLSIGDATTGLLAANFDFV